ncbi:MAG: hypothetical protein M1539_02250 [Actinobacteria bacterium]|nr:hypothetical protein [Actinomycetota bacterium]MCL5882790.1 hypothetical protein [Actinomycetota bacterium]
MEASEKPMEGRGLEGYPGLEEKASVHHLHNAGASFRHRISGGAIVAGALVGLALQLLFIAFGTFLGFSAASVASLTDLQGIVTSVGIWVAVSTALSTFIGGYIAARLADTTITRDGLWHGITTWGLLIIAGLFLSVLGVVGVMGFGLSASSLLHAYLPGATAFAAADLSTAASITTTLSGWFLIGALVSLVTAGLGGVVGCMRVMSRRMEVMPVEGEEKKEYIQAA